MLSAVGFQSNLTVVDEQQVALNVISSENLSILKYYLVVQWGLITLISQP